jgi:predicted SpoU family rRNA methylase
MPHFSNKDKNLAINGYPSSEISSIAVLLEKKLLNDVGWKVINLEMPNFLDLSLS